MPLRTFISYNREDHQLALKFSTQVRLPASRDIETSVDTESLPPGLLFSPALSRFVVLADWFILIYTQGNKRYEYSMFEAGQYFDSHHMDSTSPPPENKTPGRFCCLYDTPEMPEVFRQHQNYQVFTFNSATGKSFRRMHNDIRTEDDFYDRVPLQRFLREFYANPTNNPLVPTYSNADNRATRITIAKNISEAFDANAFDKVINEDVLQHRLDIHIPDDLVRADKGRPDFASMHLTGQKETLRLFGLVATSDLKWADLRRAFRGRSTAWMDEIELGIEGVVGQDHRLPEPMDVSFTLPTFEQRHFRPVLARFQEFQKGSYNFFVSLYESTHRQLNDAELLISGITLGSRFKDLINDKELFDSTVQDDLLVTAARKLRRRLALIEGESAELGLTNPAKLQDALCEEHKSEVDDFFNQWRPLREKWLDGLSRLEADKDPTNKEIVEQVYESLKPINLRFLNACAESYLATVKKWGQ